MTNGKQEKTIRYFSMFTGVGGFELGLQDSESGKSLQGAERRGIQSTRNKSNDKVWSDKQSEAWRDRKLQQSEDNSTNAISTSSRNESRRAKEDSRSIKPVQMATQQFTCIGVSEIDKYASELLKQKFPTIKNWGDATKINPSELPDFDMLCGGFPCQAFSIAGKRRGFEDTRGTLFFDIARIIKVKRPKTLLLENVKGLLNHNKGQTFRKIIQTISELGYDVQWMVLNSKFHGVPQNRERVFIIGSLRETSRPEILPFRETSGKPNKRNTEEQIASSLQHPGHSGGNYKGMNMIRAVLTPDREKKRQNGRRFKEPGEPSFTITGQDIHGVAIDYINKSDKKDFRTFGQNGIAHSLQARSDTHKLQDTMKIRRLTPTECERLQGFPDGWTLGFSDTQRYKMMGNAVTVNVIRAIAQKLTLINTQAKENSK